MNDDIKTLEDKIKELSTTSKGEVLQPWSSDLVALLGISLLAFCVVVLLIGAVLLWKKEVDGLVVLKLFGLTMIISVSAFLMVAGYGQEQLTPIVGLFGAIAGYLLGKESNS